MTRSYPDRPLVGVGAVVWRDERVLLIRRAKPPRKGEWSLPGGAQKLGETVVQAAHREVGEETGLAIEVLGIIDVIDSIREDAEGRIEYHYTLVDVAALAKPGEARAGSDAAEVAWFAADDIPALGLWAETERVIARSRDLVNVPGKPR